MNGKFCRLFLQFSFLVIKIRQICNSANKIFSKIKAIFFGVVKKHNFCNIQQKILQISDFAKKQDSNPLPHGDVAAGIAKMFAKKF
jgi:hypothetical protein